MKLADGTYDNDKQFTEFQDKWIETNDKKYIWKLYPLWLHAIKSCMVKRLKGKKIQFFNEKAEEAAMYQMENHIKHPENKYQLMKYASCLAMYALYTKHPNTNWDVLETVDEIYGGENDN